MIACRPGEDHLGWDGTQFERDTPAFDQSQVLEVVHEPPEATHVVDEALDGGCVGFDHPVGDRLEVGAQRGERRAQLVGCIGDHGAMRRFGPRQIVGHGVERNRELAEFAVAGRACPGLPIPASRPVDGVDQVTNRAGDPACQRDGHDRADHQRPDAGEHEPPVDGAEGARRDVALVDGHGVEEGRSATEDEVVHGELVEWRQRLLGPRVRDDHVARGRQDQACIFASVDALEDRLDTVPRTRLGPVVEDPVDLSSGQHDVHDGGDLGTGRLACHQPTDADRQGGHRQHRRQDPQAQVHRSIIR